MKTLTAVLLAAALACSCGRPQAAKETFAIETVNKATPVKDQGRSPLCWLYAMLAVVESDRLMLGDSVNLSPHFTARAVLADMAERRYLTHGTSPVSADGTAADALAALAEYGVMPYDAYRSECSYTALCRKLTALADQGTARLVGLERLRDRAAYMLDTAVNPAPRRVWLYGMEYTPRQFAEDVVLDVPANRRGRRFYNVPLDTLQARVTAALRSGRSVCWEGGISNGGFSFADGTARLADEAAEVTQAARQKAFERFEVTDDHCMAIIGTARDGRGRLYFVCKNSWGTDNPYGGLMYMSEQYFRLNTVAVVMKADKPAPAHVGS